jgi:hypothetical protein
MSVGGSTDSTLWSWISASGHCVRYVAGRQMRISGGKQLQCYGRVGDNPANAGLPDARAYDERTSF